MDAAPGSRKRTAKETAATGEDGAADEVLSACFSLRLARIGSQQCFNIRAVSLSRSIYSHPRRLNLLVSIPIFSVSSLLLSLLSLFGLVSHCHVYYPHLITHLIPYNHFLDHTS